MTRPSRSPERKRQRDHTASGFEPVYSSAVALGRALFGFWRLKPAVVGIENVPDHGGAVLAMTHFGYFEFALVEWVTFLHNRRRIRFMAKREAFDKPLVGGLLRSMKHISVDRKAGAAAYVDAVAALKRGELIGVFPEAGVSASMTVRELKTGAARLAAEAGVPLIPVSVWGGQRLMTKGHKTSFLERFGVDISFTFGSPIAVTSEDDVVRATTALRDKLQQMVDQEQQDYPVDGTGMWWQPQNRGGTAPTPEEAAASEVERARRREIRNKR
ncbi:lysophospholipid acyltransferase family protein [Salinibacterium sp. G-O1]|uniref:lysophospholipid acyltransferase family protein n=1 Tax=Salinibacterium sp. G-O1 TaxID=3046208 RepID=UPI0024BB3802|nr:lysophospholipid acyltransferase family protein [Salinibacterium sp. G-O1]MDJ0334776.1 lysophospholipid acyltransferase family protein [Salinibacterium sp. G-O1]